MLVLYDMGLFFNLLSVELLLTQETRFSKSCFHWKFCFKPQIPLRFPVKTENRWFSPLSCSVQEMFKNSYLHVECFFIYSLH